MKTIYNSNSAILQFKVLKKSIRQRTWNNNHSIQEEKLQAIYTA